ncbi:MAG: 30S ribosomal protein S2 [Mycoplasmataceae bacterium]|nr:30S ribosomal protein S2 [Mycoplasmataceae bacterium]
MTKPIISKDKLLESGIHYGHQTKSWNPAMKPFIAMSRRNIHLINLDKSTQSLENSYNIVKKITERRGVFLFVGTTKQSSKTVRENAERVGSFYIDHRWLGGILTNFRTIQNSINKLKKLERLDKTGFEGYTKKEAILMKKKLDKLEKVLGGIKHMRRLPQAIFVTSIRNEDIAIKEARKMKIPVFGIADTNVDPYTVNFPIFGNDDANKSTALITTVIADAIADVKKEKKLAAYVENDEVEIMGIIPQEEKRSRYPKKEYRFKDDNSYAKRKEFKTFIQKPENKLVETKSNADVKKEIQPKQVESKEIKSNIVLEKTILVKKVTKPKPPTTKVTTTKKVTKPKPSTTKVTTTKKVTKPKPNINTKKKTNSLKKDIKPKVRKIKEK